ncbi:MAG: methyltransferase domain-containing protein [Nitrospirota bacterium]|jgi:2-polyprenyl-6-hydroxyphenyl methylase/3-demethylubiquinone-9 3-methyltransferase|nr:methyltransferase domain-containing protein [Nitrospirota bacterium]
MMETAVDISGYVYEDPELNASHDYLVPALLAELAALRLPTVHKRVFEVGCGNGAVADVLTRQGYLVTGVDASAQGIEQAKRRYPQSNLQLGSAYDPLAETYGKFPVVVSLEVVEHLYAPRVFARALFDLVEPSGTVIVSTPYHGYWKNLAMALTGRLDHHFTALWDHGHIKFWSIGTLRLLLQEAGFHSIRFRRVGRVPALAKSMIAIATRS